MDKNEKVSIIVPFFNVETYISKCLETLLNQTYKNIEILLIDDGSTDNSFSIVESYQKKDKRIKIFRKENSGKSDARNLGLENAMGDYICFVNSDDFVTLDFVEFLYNVSKKHNCDISCCQSISYLEREKTYEQSNLDEKEIVYENHQQLFVDYFLSIGIESGICNKLFKKSLFNTLRFDSETVYEDFDIIPMLFGKSQLVVFNSSAKYIYRKKENLKTSSSYWKKHESVFETVQKAKNYLVKNEYEDLLDFYNAYCFNIYNDLYKKLIYSNYEGKNDVIKKIKEQVRLMENDIYIFGKDKVEMDLIRIPFCIYRIIYISYQKLKKLQNCRFQKA